MRSITVNDINIGNDKPFVLIAGLNVLEDEKTIRLVLNHPVIESQELSINDFNVNIDNISASVESIELDSSNNRVLLLEMSEFLNFWKFRNSNRFFFEFLNFWTLAQRNEFLNF